jgi:hypothetical protein
MCRAGDISKLSWGGWEVVMTGTRLLLTANSAKPHRRVVLLRRGAQGDGHSDQLDGRADRDVQPRLAEADDAGRGEVWV